MKLRLLLGSALWPAMAILILLVFLAYAIFGPNGVLAWGDYARQAHERQTQLQQLKAQEAALNHRVKLLDPNHVDPDMADQLVRERLGVTHPDEVVLMQK